LEDQEVAPLNVGTERRLKKAIADVHAFAMDIVRARRQSASRDDHDDRDDALSRFVAASADNSDKALRDTVLSLLIAGRETTSSALTWFFWLVSSRAAAGRRVARRRRGPRGAGVDRHAPRRAVRARRAARHALPALHAALTESMRLYVPAGADRLAVVRRRRHAAGRHARRRGVVRDVQRLRPWGASRLYGGEDCAEYRPERWLGDADDGAFRPESPFRYAVFHAGPRMCLGKEMAYVQMKSIVASVLEEFVVGVEKDSAGGVPEHVLSVTLRMKGGLPVQVRRRVVSFFDSKPAHSLINWRVSEITTHHIRYKIREGITPNTWGTRVPS
jgi:cytochrome P450